MLLALAMLYPLLKLGGFFPQPLPADFNPIPDQEFALETHAFTLQMTGEGGVPTLIQNFAQMIHGFYKGFLSLDGFYPVYPSLLVTITQKNFDDFVSNVIGLNFLLLLFFFALLFLTLRRIEGDVFALLTLSFLFFFSPLLWNGQQFGADLILLACSTLCWFNLVEEEEINSGRNFSSGMWAGIAFLTAPFGGLLFLTVVLYFLLTFHLRFFKQKALFSFLLGFILLASPILVRDLWLHHNPFHGLLLTFKNSSVNFNLLEGNKWLWFFYSLGWIGIFLDSNKKRRNLSFILWICAFLGNFPLLIFLFSSFYSAALFHTMLVKLFSKKTVWLGLTLATFLFLLSWYHYLA